MKTEQFFVKDLKKQLFDVENTVIVDDQERSFINDQKNGICMKEFYGRQDDCLLTLTEYLIQFSADFDLDKLKHTWQ